MLLKVLKPLTVDNISEASRKQLRRLFALSPQIKKKKNYKAKQQATHLSFHSFIHQPGELVVIRGITEQHGHAHNDLLHVSPAQWRREPGEMWIIYCTILILPSSKHSKYEYSLFPFNGRILCYLGMMLLTSNLVEIFV